MSKRNRKAQKSDENKNLSQAEIDKFWADKAKQTIEEVLNPVLSDEESFMKGNEILDGSKGSSIPKKQMIIASGTIDEVEQHLEDVGSEGSGESVFELSEEVKSILLQPTRLIRILKFRDYSTIHADRKRTFSVFPTPEKKTLLTRIKQIVIRKVIVEKLSMITIEQKALV